MDQKKEKDSQRQAADELFSLYQKMYRAMISKDISALQNILSEGFYLQHMSGMIQDKEEYLKAIADGTLNYFDQKPQHFGCRFDGNRASVRAESQVEAAVFGGGKHTWPLGLNLEAEKTQEGWKFTGAKAYAY